MAIEGTTEVGTLPPYRCGLRPCILNITISKDGSVREAEKIETMSTLTPREDVYEQINKTKYFVSRTWRQHYVYLGTLVFVVVCSFL